MNCDMYLFVFQGSKNYPSILSKIAVMSLVIFDVHVSNFKHVFAYKETRYVKVSNLSLKVMTKVQVPDPLYLTCNKRWVNEVSA